MQNDTAYEISRLMAWVKACHQLTRQEKAFVMHWVGAYLVEEMEKHAKKRRVGAYTNPATLITLGVEP